MTDTPDALLFRLSDDAAQATIDAALYPEDVVYKALYWYTGRYDVSIRASEGCFRVTLRHTEGPLTDELLEALKRKLSRDLVDFKTRSIVARETRVVRELLVAKAFSSIEAFAPPGSTSDPVGFDVAKWDEG